MIEISKNYYFDAKNANSNFLSKNYFSLTTVNIAKLCLFSSLNPINQHLKVSICVMAIKIQRAPLLYKIATNWQNYPVNFGRGKVW